VAYLEVRLHRHRPDGTQLNSNQCERAFTSSCKSPAVVCLATIAAIKHAMDYSGAVNLGLTMLA